MESAFRQVCRFEEAFGHELSSKPPAAPSRDTIRLRRKLILEEARETLAALRVVQKAVEAGDSVTGEMLAEVADGSADLQFVCKGTDVAFGVDGPAVMNEVCRANLSKFGPGHYYDETGKLRKPPGFKPPDILGVIMNQKPLAELYGSE
ncbi:MAG: hypothetical protein P4L67_05185 [Candidatus Pacebacteria bacterium]|nr:hypothetical protein [Candidatus Paceibacterota bacterium]